MELSKPLAEPMSDTTLEKILNLTEKGSDVIILHPGSQTLKFGLASQTQPFIMPNAIAHKLLKPSEVKEISAPIPFSLMMEGENKNEPSMKMQITDYVEQALEQKLSYIEPVLCRLKHITVDQRRPKYSKKSQGPHDPTQPLTVNHKPLPYQVYTEVNGITHIPENLPSPADKWTTNLSELIASNINEYLSGNQFSFVDVSSKPDYLVGQAAININKNDGYLLQYPLKHGYFNVSAEQSVGTVLDNLEKIFEFALIERLKIPKSKFSQYSVILVIPDLFNRSEVKGYLDILLKRLSLKSAYIQQESVLASFAYALNCACVVDIGAQKTNVCCVDDGAIIPGTILRRHMGGDDITLLLHRLLTRNGENSLHYFPTKLINISDQYHARILEKIKEDECYMGKNVPDPVKTCKIWIHEKNKKTTVAAFNVSDALVTSAFGLFYPDLLDIVNPKYPVSPSTFGHLEMNERDPEDVMQILISETLTEGGKKGEDDKKDLQKKSEEGKEDLSKEGSEQKSKSKEDDNSSSNGEAKEEKDSSVELEKSKAKEESLSEMCKAMSIAEMICKSLMKVDDPELRQKLANSILLVGGSTKFKDLMDVLEERLVEKLGEFTNNIERVEVVNNSSAQKGSMDNRFLSWIGASVIPKIEITKDMFIPKEKWICDLPKYYETQFATPSEEEVKAPQPMQDEIGKGSIAKPENQKEKENAKKTQKKEFSVDGGLKLIREKCPFVW